MTRRKWLAAAGGGLAASCGRKTGTGFAGYALIATAGDTSVSIADLAAFRLSKQVQVGHAPEAILAGGPDGASYVLTPRSGSVHVLDSGFNRVISAKFADGLAAFQVAPDRKHLLAIAGHSRELIEADSKTLALTRRWKLRAEPVSLDVSPDGSVAISAGARGLVELIGRADGKRAERQFAGRIGAVRFRADGKLLLVANYAEQVITALDVPTLQAVVDLPLAMQPQNLCFKPDGGQLFVTGEGMDGLAIAFPYLPLEVEQTVLAGRDPGAMACSEDPAYLFVASASGSDVCILNVANRRMIGVVEVGQRPGFIAVTPDSQYALVLNEGSGDMAVIRIASIENNMGDPAKKRGKAGASLFTMLPVGSRPVHAAIIPKRA